jgi:nicotinate-nucleotide pyrophosphorylase (carboxylating)
MLHLILCLSQVSCRGLIKAKADGVFAGVEIVKWFQAIYAKTLKFDLRVNDGDIFRRDDVLLVVDGAGSDVLAVERTLLNVLQRLSGIATETNRWIESSVVPVAATRKTHWGRLDKYAVAVGGGLTHRLSLADAPMIKENHLSLISGGLDSFASS